MITPPALPPYRCRIEPDWIDYNGHLRDAFYLVVLSLATDDLMDRIGVDAAYRESTRCTLFTLETHIHYLREIKLEDELAVSTVILDADAKRILAGARFECPRLGEPAAVAESLLMHVIQRERPASAPFPPEIAGRVQALRADDARRAAWTPPSRKIELRRR